MRLCRYQHNGNTEVALVGHARKPPVYLRAGDTVKAEIEGIGVLRNPVEVEKKTVGRSGRGRGHALAPTLSRSARLPS